VEVKKQNKNHKRKPGEMEIRILPDGRVVMLAPDEKVIEVIKGATGHKDGASREVKDNGKDS
jgi:hypothetical protein